MVSCLVKIRNRIVRSKDVVFGLENYEKVLTLFPGENVNKEVEQNQTENRINLLSEMEEETKTEECVYNLRKRDALKTQQFFVEIMVTKVDEPKNYKKATKSAEKAQYVKAMEEEMTSLVEIQPGN